MVPFIHKTFEVGPRQAVVNKANEKLGFQVKGRIVSRRGDDYQLREQPAAYSAHFAPENALLSDDNTCFWSISNVI